MAAERRADLIAERMRVLGQARRLQLIEQLVDQPTTVQALASLLGTTQQNVSQHLAILQRAGILSRRKEGRRVHYELADPHILPLLAQAEASLSHHLDELSRAGRSPRLESRQPS